MHLPGSQQDVITTQGQAHHESYQAYALKLLLLENARHLRDQIVATGKPGGMLWHSDGEYTGGHPIASIGTL